MKSKAISRMEKLFQTQPRLNSLTEESKLRSAFAPVALQLKVLDGFEINSKTLLELWKTRKGYAFLEARPILQQRTSLKHPDSLPGQASLPHPAGLPQQSSIHSELSPYQSFARSLTTVKSLKYTPKPQASQRQTLRFLVEGMNSISENEKNHSNPKSLKTQSSSNLVSYWKGKFLQSFQGNKENK